jgi:beta-phosphoglucomutase-like phosphatase (HAD superfamily)
LFDLDGVLTKTPEVPAAAWKEMFDAYLRSRTTDAENRFVPL